MSKNQVQFKAVAKTFLDKQVGGGVRVTGAFCIEVLHDRKWRLLADDKGVVRFKSKEARDAEITRLRAEFKKQEG